MKPYLIGIIGVPAVIIISMLILAFTGNETVSGTDAINIAASQPGYWITIAMVIITSAATIFFAIKKDVTGMGIQLLCVVIAAAIALAVVGRPANIKADPIGSGATTEQINYLREKGMK